MVAFFGGDLLSNFDAKNMGSYISHKDWMILPFIRTIMFNIDDICTINHI